MQRSFHIAAEYLCNVNDVSPTMCGGLDACFSDGRAFISRSAQALSDY
jgi:hypothetical protein